MVEKVIKIIAEALEVEESSITLETDIQLLKNWDSLAQVQIIAEIESLCDVSIPIERATSMRTVREFVDVVSG